MGKLKSSHSVGNGHADNCGLKIRARLSTCCGSPDHNTTHLQTNVKRHISHNSHQSKKTKAGVLKSECMKPVQQ